MDALTKWSATAQKPTRARLTFKQLVLLCLACVFGLGAAGYGYYWWTVDRFFQSTDDAYVGGDVTPISPHIAGFIAEVAIKDNELVHAGQLLVRLDDRDTRAAADHAQAVREQREATLASLQAKYELQQSTIRQASADLDAKTAQAEFAKVDADRYRTLALSNYGSRQDAERTSALDQQARAAVTSAQAALAAAKQQLSVLNADIAQASAAVAQARADLETARLNLGYAEIRSPIDGYVGNRAARVGAYVSQGTYLLTIVPSHGLWVDANFKEDQLGRMQLSQPATVVADTLPGHLFHGHLLSLAPATGAVFSVIPPENATGNFTKIVQRVAADRARRRGSELGSDKTRPVDDRNDRHAIAIRRPAMSENGSNNWLKSIVPFIAMCFGGFMALLDIQIVASSLQNIGGGLSAAQDEISWVQTAYLIAEIIVIPLSGWLTRVFSTRWLFTASAAGFTVTSMLCGVAWDIHSMILFRALQGALGASMIPIVFTSSLHYFQGPRRVYSAAVVGTIASVAPTLGPIIGGWITDTLDWHWLFYVNLAPGIAITLLVPFLVDIDKPDLRLLKDADYPGIVLMGIGLGTLEYVLEEGTRWNWFDDDTIRACAYIAGVSGILFVWRSLTFPRPVVDLRALTNRNFALGCFLSFVTGVGIFSTIYLTPLFLGYVRGFSAWQTGTAIFSTGAASLIGVPIYIFLAKKFDIRWLMMLGLASFGLAMWSYTFITHDWGADQLLIPQMLRGLPQVFAVAPAVNLGLASLPADRLKYASGLFNMMRNLGGAVGIAVCGAIINARTNFHFVAIASNLTPTNGAMTRFVDEMGQRYGSIPGSLQEGHAAALKQLGQLAFREASTLAYADAFRAIMIAFIVATLLVPFLRNIAATPTPAASH